MARKPSVKQPDHADAVAARARVVTIIDSVSPQELVDAIKRAPSLRGMILGYIAEEKFEKIVLKSIDQVAGIQKHDDHDRKKNKGDRSFIFNGRTYSVQLKSMQTNTITYNTELKVLTADVQNRSGSGCLNNFPRFISGFRAG